MATPHHRCRKRIIEPTRPDDDPAGRYAWAARALDPLTSGWQDFGDAARLDAPRGPACVGVMIATPNACPFIDDRAVAFPVRHFGNGSAAAMADYRVAQARPGAEIVITRIDLDALTAYRPRVPNARNP